MGRVGMMDVGIVTVGIEGGRGVAMLRVGELILGMVTFGIVRLGMARLGTLRLGVPILVAESVRFGNVGVRKPVTFRDDSPEGTWAVRRDIGEVVSDVSSDGGLSVGNSGVERLGVKVGALKLTLGVPNGNPSEGGPTEEMLNDESPTVGLDMLRLGESIVKDGIARDGMCEGVVFKDGRLIVGPGVLRLGDETVSGGISRDGVTGDGKSGVGVTSVGFETSRL